MFAGSFSIIVVWLLALSGIASGQTTNATCMASHKWAFNSQQQSPCLVGSALLAVCSGSYQLNALPDGYHYTGPTLASANPCQCSTVVYSLLAECGLCQNRTASMWSVWETDCASVSINSFPEPIPAGLHVPGWAYLNVQATDMFNEALAQANANITESTAIPQPDKTSSSSMSTPSSTSAAPATTTASSESTGLAAIDQSRSNAIGGGVVGGFCALLLICGLAFWLHRRRSDARSNGQLLNSPVMSQYPTDSLPGQPTILVPSITVSSLDSRPSGSAYSGQVSV
ncbi:hypothetical protein B0H10DRAFT_2010009 [Mycena sp. CBHHK59/15]|nr:hypothetical protein B0H10DRAFT_2010009 [Mycena sp. CBHHK59/15]